MPYQPIEDDINNSRGDRSFYYFTISTGILIFNCIANFMTFFTINGVYKIMKNLKNNHSNY